ncbi:hypothetical protein LTR84_012461 [Exophiala bonariae]|uniref:Protein kinase domain-containing protein n=1 Tax=Exophiala bonariae TaxID=1690606 RepID=A0AAV9NGN4_9EURO|nr:hypothetical protein LTR84_012461 [Exophiala bonariae]
MATTAYKYGIFFPEHTGHLYVRRLAPGREGDVTLTRSIADGSLQVRKNTHPTDRENVDSKIPEVQFQRHHPLIPSLNFSQDYNVLNIYHKDHERLKSTVMYSKFCNGGTLWEMSCYFELQKDRHMPEVLLWRLLDQRLQTLLFLHHSQGGLTKLDNHMNNVWLHYEDGSKLPNFYTGDLGHVRPINPAIWEETTAHGLDASLKVRKLKDLELPNRHAWDNSPQSIYNPDLEAMSSDIANVWTGLVHLMYGIDTTYIDPADAREASMEAREWSEELYECEWRLKDIAEFFDAAKTTRYSDLEPLAVEVKRIAKLSADGDPDADVRLALWNVDDTCPSEDFDEDYDTRDEMYSILFHRYVDAHKDPQRPALFDSRVELLQLAKRWPEPWRIARVDESTGRVLGVEKMAFHLSNPRLPTDGHEMEEDDTRNLHLAQSGSRNIGLEDLLLAAEAADTTTHRISEDFSITGFARGPNDDPNEDEIFGLDPEWTAERLAGPAIPQELSLKQQMINREKAKQEKAKQEVVEVEGTIGKPLILDDSDEMDLDNSGNNPIVIDDDSDDDLMEIDSING